jgi:hypothetical protein
MYVDVFKSSNDVFLNVPLTFLNVPLTFLIIPSMLIHVPSTVSKNSQTFDDASLARPIRLFKKVGLIKTTSKGSTYLLVKVL